MNRFSPSRLSFGVLLVLLISVVFAVQAAGPDQKINLAVMSLKAGTGVSVGESDLISDRLRGELFSTGKANVMERDQMQEILKEQGFQQSGVCSDEACLVSMGQMLGVQSLVTGSIGKLGSMFMINARMIDVQTARITKVVSKDVRGGIEDVVDELKNIARQLIGADAVSEPSVRNTTRRAQPQVETPKVIATPVVEEKEPEPPREEPKPEEIDPKKERNRNRGGIGIAFDIGGRPRHFVDGLLSDTIFLLAGTTYKEISSDGYSVSGSPLMSFLLRFHIKAGPFLEILIGPGFLKSHERYEQYFGNEAVDISYSMLSVRTGLAFVKRWYPLKLNVGINFDFDLPITRYSIGYIDSSYSSDYLFEDVNVGFNASFGSRSGVEILAGPHVGFSFDLVLRWLKYSIDFDFDELDYYSTENMYMQEIQFPIAGFGIGVNFYF